MYTQIKTKQKTTNSSKNLLNFQKFCTADHSNQVETSQIKHEASLKRKVANSKRPKSSPKSISSKSSEISIYNLGREKANAFYQKRASHKIIPSQKLFESFKPLQKEICWLSIDPQSCESAAYKSPIIMINTDSNRSSSDSNRSSSDQFNQIKTYQSAIQLDIKTIDFSIKSFSTVQVYEEEKKQTDSEQQISYEIKKKIQVKTSPRQQASKKMIKYEGIIIERDQEYEIDEDIVDKTQIVSYKSQPIDDGVIRTYKPFREQYMNIVKKAKKMFIEGARTRHTLDFMKTSRGLKKMLVKVQKYNNYKSEILAKYNEEYVFGWFGE